MQQVQISTPLPATPQRSKSSRASLQVADRRTGDVEDQGFESDEGVGTPRMSMVDPRVSTAAKGRPAADVDRFSHPWMRGRGEWEGKLVAAAKAKAAAAEAMRAKVASKTT